MFNPCGKFRWSPEDPVSQIHSPHLLVGAPGIFSDLLRPVQMIKREWGAESNGKLQHLLNPSKTAALVPEFAVEGLPSAELQPRFLRLQWRTCLWAEHSDDIIIIIIIIRVFSPTAGLSLQTQAPRRSSAQRQVFHRKFRNQDCDCVHKNSQNNIYMHWSTTQGLKMVEFDRN